MKLSKQTIIIAIILSVALFLIGQYTSVKFFFLTLPTEGGVKYVSTRMTGHSINPLWFSLTLALIPIMTILVWRYAPVFSTKRRVITVCILILAASVSLLLRREMIKSKARNLQPITILDYTDPANPQPKTVESNFPIETLNFELFTFAGLIVGSAIAFFSLSQKIATYESNQYP